jgi:hypothetical protein
MADRTKRMAHLAPLGRLGDYVLGAAIVRLTREDFQSISRGMCISADLGQLLMAWNLGAPMTASADFLSNDDQVSFLQVEDAALSLDANGTLEIFANDVTERARAGDSVVLLKQTSGKMLIVFSAFGSTLENQLCWLLDVPREFGDRFAVANPKVFAAKAIGFPELMVLASLGLVPEPV